VKSGFSWMATRRTLSAATSGYTDGRLPVSDRAAQYVPQTSGLARTGSELNKQFNKISLNDDIQPLYALLQY
jgi:hypothetical protein